TPVWGQSQMREMVLRAVDLGKTMALHRELILPFLREGSAESRLVAVENLSRAGAPAEDFVAELVPLATGESKRVREVAAAMLTKGAGAARPLLETAARAGGRGEREQAVRLLGNLCCEEARPFLVELLAAEKSAPIKEVIEQVLGNLRPPEASVGAMPEPPPH